MGLDDVSGALQIIESLQTQDQGSVQRSAAQRVALRLAESQFLVQNTRHHKLQIGSFDLLFELVLPVSFSTPPSPE